MQVNPNLFFLAKNGKIIAWDYKNHQQFSLKKEYFERLLLWSEEKELDPLPIDEELLNGNLLLKAPCAQEEWGWDLLSQIYHVGTNDIGRDLSFLSPDEWTEQYLNYCKEIAQSPLNLLTYKQGESFKLPEPDFNLIKDKQLLETFIKRKTCRSFNGVHIKLNLLSTLLFVSLGPVHKEWSDLVENNLSTMGIRKVFPSGGGLHPEEAYVVILRVEGLKEGVYHYRFHDHTLILIQEGYFEETLVEMLFGQYYLKGISFGIFLSARFDKSWWKYPHSRGYRVVLFDIGHASQTILLTATALGLNTWLSAAFNDTEVNKFLGIESNSESSLFFIGAGHGDDKSLSPQILHALKEES